MVEPSEHENEDHEALPETQAGDDTAGAGAPTPPLRSPVDWGDDRPDAYDKTGRPLTMTEFAWLKWGVDGYRRVAEDVLADGTWVSTVWLGLDHRFIGDGPPLIFETMVFAAHPDSATGPLRSRVFADQECHRYPTEAAALAGHDQVVAKITEALDRLAAAMDEIDPSAGGPVE